MVLGLMSERSYPWILNAAVGRACCTRSSPNIWRPSCSSRAWPKQQLPGHFEEELRVYLKCGILAHGFVRLRCADCESLRDVTSTGAPLPPPPGPSVLFVRRIEVQTLKCVLGAFRGPSRLYRQHGSGDQPGGVEAR